MRCLAILGHTHFQFWKTGSAAKTLASYFQRLCTVLSSAFRPTLQDLILKVCACFSKLDLHLLLAFPNTLQASRATDQNALQFIVHPKTWPNVSPTVLQFPVQEILTWQLPETIVLDLYHHCRLQTRRRRRENCRHCPQRIRLTT